MFGGRMLRMLLNSLYMLEQRTKPAALIKGVFEMRTAALSGFCPSLECCALCGEGNARRGISGCHERAVALRCLQGAAQSGGIGAASEEALGERSISIPLTEPVLAAMRFALAAPDRKIFSFSLETAQAEAFSSATEVYLLNHPEHGFETLNFYRSVASSAERAVTKDREVHNELLQPCAGRARRRIPLPSACIAHLLRQPDSVWRTGSREAQPPLPTVFRHRRRLPQRTVATW